MCGLELLTIQQNVCVFAKFVQVAQKTTRYCVGGKNVDTRYCAVVFLRHEFQKILKAKIAIVFINYTKGEKSENDNKN